MPYKQQPAGNPDCQVLEEFINGTMPTPAEKLAKAKKLAAEQTASNKDRRTSQRKRAGE